MSLQVLYFVNNIKNVITIFNINNKFNTITIGVKMSKHTGHKVSDHRKVEHGHGGHEKSGKYESGKEHHGHKHEAEGIKEE